MTREIKFRAWEKEEEAVGGGTMWEVREIVFADGEIMSLYLGLHSQDMNENIHLMQFTGLLDKNGKEIWEGDIVESFVLLSENGENIRTVVKWGENGWLANGALSNHPQWMNNHQPEVIGNIYETPNLIRGKEEITKTP